LDLLALNRLWKEPDVNGKRMINLEEFQKAIIYHHVLINENEAQQLFNELDIKRTGLLDYDEFLTKLLV
jgi:Ca2+-binding EF-hand superfamily protein